MEAAGEAPVCGLALVIRFSGGSEGFKLCVNSSNSFRYTLLKPLGFGHLLSEALFNFSELCFVHRVQFNNWTVFFQDHE